MLIGNFCMFWVILVIIEVWIVFDFYSIYILIGVFIYGW